MRFAFPLLLTLATTAQAPSPEAPKQAAPLVFPTEMCVGIGFYFPGRGQINCVDGTWPAPMN